MKTRIISLLTAAALVVVPAHLPFAQVRLPALGDAAADGFSVGDERRLGEQIMREVRRDPAYLDEPLLLDYLQSLWVPLVVSARNRGDIGADTYGAFAWESFLVRDRSVNAFALPGGFVGVHLGLIAMTAQRDELASVLAHELSHVTQRHIARSMANAERQGMLGMAAMILGMIAASRAGNVEMAQAAVVGSQAVMAQGQLNYSRDMEREADRIGYGVFVDAGFAPQGMAAMFERLAQASRLVDDNAFPYLRSHPLTVERIGEAKARVEATSGAAQVPSTGVVEHALMQVRARVLMDTSVQTLQRLQQGPLATGGTPVERLAAAYGQALARLQLGDAPGAQRALDVALAVLRTSPLREAQDMRAQRALVALQAEVALARGDAVAALAMIEGAPGASTRPMLLLRAQAALDVQRHGGAAAVLRPSVEALQTWVAEHRDDAGAWSMLARTSDALGLPLRAVRAEAEARAAVGDLAGAIDRLQAAQRLGRSAAEGDHIEQSVIDSRLRELMQRRRQLLAEMRGERIESGTGP